MLFGISCLVLGLAALPGCSEKPAPHQEPEPLREYRFPLFERLPEFLALEGLPNGSSRFLHLGQDANRNEVYDRLRLLGPVSCTIAGPEICVPSGAEVDLEVGLDWLDVFFPLEGSGAEFPADAGLIRQRFELAWLRDGAEQALLGRFEVELAPTAHRVRRAWKVDLESIQGQQGRLMFRTRRLEGPSDLRVLPAWWGPRLLVTAARCPAVFHDVDPDMVVLDLLGPDVQALVEGADGSSLPVASPALPQVVLRRERWEDADEGSVDDVFLAPLVGVEAHFSPGSNLAVPLGGVRPAYTFAGDATLAWLELPAVASGGKLEFELGLLEEHDQPASGRVDLSVGWNDEPLSEFVFEAAADPGQQGWGSVVSIQLPEFDADDPPVLRLSVRFNPRDPSRQQREVGDRSREVVVEQSQLGLSRPRVVRPCLGGSEMASAERPSVIVVSIETLRADAVGLGDDGLSRTPVLDGWAQRRGLLFEAAYSPAPWTLPAVASLLTGLAPHEHGAVDERADLLGDWTWTLAEDARDRGVHTAGFFSNKLMRRETGFDAGFETFVCAQAANAAQIRRSFEDWVGRQDGERYFAYLHFFDPHDPYNAPGDLRHADVPAGLRSSPYAMSLATVRAAMRERLDASTAPEELEYLRARYLGEVRYIDRQIGALLAGLERTGRLEHTRVIVVADHGEEFGEHGWLGHGTQLFEECVRVPLMVFGPGVVPGRVGGPVETLQVAARVAADFQLDRRGPAPLPLRPESTVRSAPIRMSTNKGIDLTSEPRHVSLFREPDRIRPRPVRAVLDGVRKAVLRLSRLPGPEDSTEGGQLDIAPLVEHLVWFDLARDPSEQSGTTGSWSEAPAWVREALEPWLAEEASGARGLSTGWLSPATLEVLEALGYVEAGAGRDEDPPSDDSSPEEGLPPEEDLDGSSGGH